MVWALWVYFLNERTLIISISPKCALKIIFFSQGDEAGRTTMDFVKKTHLSTEIILYQTVSGATSTIFSCLERGSKDYVLYAVYGGKEGGFEVSGDGGCLLW